MIRAVAVAGRLGSVGQWLSARRMDILWAEQEFGWVFGIDYAGPLEPGCDGNVWALFGVETGHTDMGFVELSHNKAGPDSLRGVKAMIREMHVMGPDYMYVGPDPKPVARIHSDQDPS